MDAFSYTNIFQTKGIEYIIIIAFLILIVPFWQIITKPLVRQKIKQVVSYLSEKILRIPKGLQYSKNHLWAQLHKNGEAVLGIDDLLNHLVGEVEIKPLVETGSIIRKGDRLVELEKDGKRLELLSPISGKILGYNTNLINDPSLINTEPYDSGWLAQIEPQSWIKESSDFVSGEDAVNWEGEEFLKFKDFMARTSQLYGEENAKLILQEGVK